MDSRHCCVCGREIEALDVFILRAQGKICSRCLLDRGIPVGGPVIVHQPLRFDSQGRPLYPRPVARGFPVV